MAQYDIDIIIPTLNSVNTIEWTILNLLSLEKEGISPNILVVDSNSKDGTLPILEKYQVKHANYPKGNMYAAINFGLSAGDSEWCTYINSDDIIFPNTFADLLKMAISKRCEVAYGNIDYIDHEGRFLHSWNSAPVSLIPTAFKSKLSPIPQPGTIFRRPLYHRLGGFNERFKFSADYDFFLRAYQMRAKFLKYKGNTVSAFRLHEQQLSREHMTRMEKEMRESYSQMIQTTSLMNRMYVRISMYIRNLPNYSIRILRWQQLNGTFAFPKTMTTKKAKRRRTL
jgi:glycosyltransferase involved in cell wall biosynthesis